MQIKQFRESLKQGFAKQHGQVEAMFAGFTTEQLGWRPDEKSWSVGQCLYHMWITNDKYLTNLSVMVRDNNRKEPANQN